MRVEELPKDSKARLVRVLRARREPHIEHLIDFLAVAIFSVIAHCIKIENKLKGKERETQRVERAERGA